MNLALDENLRCFSDENKSLMRRYVHSISYEPEQLTKAMMKNKSLVKRNERKKQELTRLVHDADILSQQIKDSCPADILEGFQLEFPLFQ